MATTKKYVSLEKLTKYDELLKAKIAADDAAALKAAKDYSDSLSENYESAGAAATVKTELEGKIDALTNGAVKANTDAIAKLNGDVNTEGSVAKSIATAVAPVQAKLDEVEGKANQNATDIDTLEGKVQALIEGTYDDTEIRGMISANADAIEEVKGTHATDKKTLEDAIALKAAQTALDEVSAVANAAVKQSDYDTKVAALVAEDERIAGLVASEAQRAAGVEAGLAERLVEVEAFFKLAEGESLNDALDTLVEIQTYITGEGAAADQMVEDIAANAKAIEDMDAAYKAADATLQANIDKKADITTVEGIDGRVGALETASATHALKTEVEAVANNLQAYSDAHASDYTNTQIDAAIKVNTDAIAKLNETYSTDAELEQAIADEVTRANAAYAVKGLETTVSNHVADAVAHITSDERTLWNAALQAADIVTGSTNGSIAVDGSDIPVKGLGSAAFTDAGAYDASGAAATVQGKLDEEIQRAKDAEKALSDRIDSFQECSEAEIIALFN